MSDPRKIIAILASDVEVTDDLVNTRVERIINRDPALGFSFREFENVSGKTYRIYFDARTSLIDVVGDQRLALLSLATFEFAETMVDELARLTNRPFYLCKFDLGAQTESNSLTLYYKRPASALSHERSEVIPFTNGNTLFLFEDDIIEFQYTVYVDEVRQSAKYDAASGVLMVTITNKK
jgi:hypothetical protein